MAAAQTSSADVQTYNRALTNLQITSTKLNDKGPELLCGISTGRARPIVPPDFRRSVFEAVHNLSHPGVKATVKLVSEKFVWHGYDVKLAPGLKNVTNVNHQKFKNILVHPSKHLPCQKRDFHISTLTLLAHFLSPVVTDTS
ncbi:Pol polyprotein [Plakobranchus ocellatus]|uniref:Pol polyprotein n=1 Tax=Plakobranchus ocellatus TaxID=259542 RepID=A0AAV3Y2T5_9GAST|nr:Pol polyprotein [Plakobranchus ocellatus]